MSFFARCVRAASQINPEAWGWYFDVVGEKRCYIVDTWWQTETGGIMVSGLPGVTPMKPGSASLPFFGVVSSSPPCCADCLCVVGVADFCILLSRSGACHSGRQRAADGGSSQWSSGHQEFLAWSGVFSFVMVFRREGSATPFLTRTSVLGYRCEPSLGIMIALRPFVSALLAGSLNGCTVSCLNDVVDFFIAPPDYKPYPGYYFTSDGAQRDEDGFLWLTGFLHPLPQVCLLSLGVVHRLLIFSAPVSLSACPPDFYRACRPGGRCHERGWPPTGNNGD